ncbi:unnamed protein product, partial [Prorocentrum cordatum]
DTTSLKQKAIAEANDKIEVLKADIEKYLSDAEQLNKEIEGHDADISAWDGDMVAASKVRQLEKADYETLHTDYSESVSALQRTIEVLKKQAYNRPQAAFVQLADLNGLSLIPPEAKRAIAVFLQQDPDAAAEGLEVSAPEAYGDEFQSKGVDHYDNHVHGIGHVWLGLEVSDYGSNSRKRSFEVLRVVSVNYFQAALDIYSEGPQDHPMNCEMQIQDVLARPGSGRPVLDRLRSIIKAAEGGHLALYNFKAKGNNNTKPAASAGNGRGNNTDTDPPQGPGKCRGGNLHKNGKGKDSGGRSEANGKLRSASSSSSSTPSVMLCQRDWPTFHVAVDMKLLTSLRSGVMPTSDAHTVAVADEPVAKELLALWCSHIGQKDPAILAGQSLTVAIPFKTMDEATKCAIDSASCTPRWVTFREGNPVTYSLRPASCCKVGNGAPLQAPAVPTVEQPKGAPSKPEGLTSIRVSVFAKYLDDSLSHITAGAALKSIWPVDLKSVQLGKWSFTVKPGTKDKDAMSLIASGPEQGVAQLLALSGRGGVFFQRLARDRDARPRTTIQWVTREDVDTDKQYLKRVLDRCAQDGGGPLVHRMGGKHDLGFEKKTQDNVRRQPPLVWRVQTPRWWAATQVAEFLTANTWTDPDVQVMLGPGSWRVKCTERPNETCSYIYLLDDKDKVKVTPATRKMATSTLDVFSTSRRPGLPWRPQDHDDEQPAKANGKGADAMQVEPDATKTDGEPAVGGGKGGDSPPASLGAATRRQDAPPAGAKPTKIMKRDQWKITDSKCLLKDAIVQEAGGAGACGHCACVLGGRLLKDSTFSDLDVVRTEALTLRIQTAQFMDADDDWAEFWAADPDNLSHTGSTFREYLAKMKVSTFWMDELQLRGVAARMKRCVTVLFKDSSGKWARRSFGADYKSRGWIALMLQDGHFQTIRPDKRWPPELARDARRRRGSSSGAHTYSGEGVYGHTVAEGFSFTSGLVCSFAPLFCPAESAHWDFFWGCFAGIFCTFGGLPPSTSTFPGGRAEGEEGHVFFSEGGFGCTTGLFRSFAAPVCFSEGAHWCFSASVYVTGCFEGIFCTFGGLLPSTSTFPGGRAEGEEGHVFFSEGACRFVEAPSGPAVDFETYLLSFRHNFARAERQVSDADAKFFYDTVSSCLDWLTAHPDATGRDVEIQRRQFEMTVKDKCEQYYLPGDVFACPCGWRVAGLPGKAREHYRAAAKHWAECQPGSRWMPENSKQVRRRLDYARPAAYKAREEKAWKSYLQRMVVLPAHLRDITHDLDKSTATRSKSHGQTYRIVHACKNCSSCVTTSGAFFSPCRAAPIANRMATLDYRAAVRDVFSTAKLVDKRTKFTNVRAANPGPRRKSKTKPPHAPDGLRVWFCNTNGLTDSHGKGKWDRIRGQLDATRAHVGCIVDTNIDESRTSSFGKLVTSIFPAYLAVPAPPGGRRGGVALFGPDELRKDPWKWSSEFDGRVVSGIPHASGSDMIIVGVYMDVKDAHARRKLADAIAVRAAASGLPALVVGDCNAEPYDGELSPWLGLMEYAHEKAHTSSTFYTHGDKMIDLAMVRYLAVESVSLDTKFSDHAPAVVHFHLEPQAVVQTIRKCHPLEIPDDWEEEWRSAASSHAAVWERALREGDVDLLWETWCDCLEASCGVPEDQRTRKYGAALKKWQRTFRGAQGHRTCVTERRLHRLLRRITEQQFKDRTGQDHPDLVRSIERTIQGLIADGVLDQDTDMLDYPALGVFLQARLDKIGQDNADARIQQWRARAQVGNLHAIFDYVKNKPFTAAPAVASGGPGPRATSKPTADPSRLVAEAVKQFNAKLHPKLDDYHQNMYFEMVRGSIEAIPAPPEDWSFEDNIGALRAALRAIAYTAAGPCDLDAGLLAKAPQEAINSLGALGDIIRSSGRWPKALLTAVTTMIPKVRDGALTDDLRPITVGAAVLRAFQKVILGRYKNWADEVQPTNAIHNLFSMDIEIGAARESGEPFVVRQSDLSNCFTRLQPELAHRLAMAFGMHEVDSSFLFLSAVGTSAVVKVGGYASDPICPERGMPQGYPASPLAAALFAGAHARRLAVLHNPETFSFRTYVDDRTITSSDIDTVTAVEGSLKELDIASGQKEDPSKEEWAGLNLPPDLLQDRERAGKPLRGHVDLLGVRFDLSGAAPPSEAPRAARRKEELLCRLGRIRRVCGGAHLAIQFVFRVVLCTMGLFRWDAPRCTMKDADISSLRTRLEQTIFGRQRHRTWRHRGAAWCLLDKGWKVEPMGVVFSSFISFLRCTRNSHLQPLIRRAWRSATGGPPLLQSMVGRMRSVFDGMGWQCGDDPYSPTFAGTAFSISISKGKLEHYVREAWRGFMMRDASATTHRKERVDLPSLDVKTLQEFIDKQPGVIDMLEKLMDKFIAERTTLEKTETKTKTQQGFEMLMQDLESSTAQAKQDREEKAELKAKAFQAKADAEGDLTDTTTTRDADQQYLTDLVASCEQKATDFLRVQAIDIISTDAVSGNAEKHLAATDEEKAACGSELAALRSATSSEFQEQAAWYIRQQTGRIGSRVLSTLAASVEADPVKKVKKM